MQRIARTCGLLVYLLLAPALGFTASAVERLDVAVGIQPLAQPTGVNGALLQRDQILAARLKQMGYPVRFAPFAKGTEITLAMKHGQVSLGYLGDLPTIEAIGQQQGAVAALTRSAFTTVISRKMAPITALKGQRIAIVPISTAHFALIQALASAGMSETDVTAVPMDIYNMAEALASGEVDAFAVWEPIATNALQRYPEFSVIHRGLTHTYLYFSQALLDGDQALILEILAAHIRSVRWMQSNRSHLEQACRWNLQDAQRFLGRPSTGTVAQCVTIVRRDLLEAVPSGRIPPVMLEEHGIVADQVRYLQSVGSIPANLTIGSILKAFKPQMIEEVLANPETYAVDRFDYKP